MKHKIQWLNLPGYKGETWNPIVGCSKISDGCKNCYAEKMANRLAHNPKTNFDYAEVITNGKWNGKTTLSHTGLFKPAGWRLPRFIFVCSMGDLFHESVRFYDIDRVFEQMMLHPRHIYIVLTKRAERMAEYFGGKGFPAFVPAEKRAHIFLGVTAENQEQVNARLPHLIRIPAAVRFVSVEPMLSQVDISIWMCSGYDEPPFDDVVNWVICGGESGHHARPLHPDWVRSIRNQCERAGVPFFFKQWGEYAPWTLTNGNQHPNHEAYHPDVNLGYDKVGKHKSGNLLDGVKCEEYPQIHISPPSSLKEGSALAGVMERGGSSAKQANPPLIPPFTKGDEERSEPVTSIKS